MEPLKYMYNDHFFNSFENSLIQVYSKFRGKNFKADVFANNWDDLELKQRMRHISTTLKAYLPDDFIAASEILINLVEILKKENKKLGFEYMFLPDYIELYGIDHYDYSMEAIEKITQYSSCEFAIRPFIIADQQRVMKQMLAWSKHEHSWVRRLSSEGCRSRLPWAMALPEFKKNPSPILPILENLKNDESEFVRKSVANNLNDIAKDDPDLVIKIAKKWKGKTKGTDWIIKHGCRTLLKQGLPEVMPIFGYGSVENIKINDFIIKTPEVKIGDALEFSFELTNNNSKPTLIRVEYGMFYMKANGTLSKKVFKISEKVYDTNSITLIQRKQSFRIISTRKFHKGLHQVSVIVNGVEFKKHNYELI